MTLTNREAGHLHAITHLKRSVAWGTAFIAIAISIYSWTLWKAENARNLAEFSSLVEIGAKALDSYFSQFESALGVLSGHLLEQRIQLRDERAAAALSNFRNAYPDLRNISVIRLDGRVLASAERDLMTQRYSVNDMPSFAQFRDVGSKERNFEVSRPIFSSMLKEWIIVLRYGMRDEAGNLLYILSAALPLSRPQGLWKHAVLPAGAALSLIRDDGYLVGRYPLPTGSALENVYGKPRTGTLATMLQQPGAPAHGIVEGQSSLPGVPPQVIYVYRRLPHFPMTFLMIIPGGDLYARWWKAVWFQYLILAVVIAGAIHIYRGLLRRQTEWAHEREATHQELEKAARTDALTGTLNRRAMIEELNRELSRSLRIGKAATVILFDLDHFKMINDRHGHATGDRVLQMFVSVVQGIIRPYDVLCRFGGEEFLLLLPNTKAEEAMITSARIRTTLELHSIESGAVRVTASAGVVDSLEEGVMGNLERILAIADARMYEAKRRRNAEVGPS